MAQTVRQPTPNPTNKLTAATLAASVVGLVQAFVVRRYPEFASPEIWIPITPLLIAVFTFAAGWFVKDAPNV